MDKALFVGNIFSSTLSLPIGRKPPMGGGLVLAIQCNYESIATRLKYRYAIEVSLRD